MIIIFEIIHINRIESISWAQALGEPSQLGHAWGHGSSGSGNRKEGADWDQQSGGHSSELLSNNDGNN